MLRLLHSTKRRWTPEGRARKHPELGSNTIMAIRRHGCWIPTATISRSFIKAKGKGLFVAKGFDGIEARGFYGGRQPPKKGPPPCGGDTQHHAPQPGGRGKRGAEEGGEAARKTTQQ